MPRHASSGPGRGGPARGGPASGEGWGGPAKGEGKRVALDEVRRLRWDEARLAEKEARTDALKGVLWGIAMSEAEPSPVRIQAADKLLDREDGKPMQRQDIKLRTTNPDEMTDEELAAIAAGRSRALIGEA